MRRRQTGIERITDELFSAEALAPLDVRGVTSPGGRLAMIASQMLRIPAQALREPSVVWVFPGYPPSPLLVGLRERACVYVHDMFLMTRPQDLNRAARLYSAPLFRAAVRRMRHFLVNSSTTASELAPHVAPDASILLYRPHVRDVFALAGSRPPARDRGAPLVVGALGTIEPRKNFLHGARICQALAEKLGRPVEYHLVGRPGWGSHADELAKMPWVRMHGFLDAAEARAVISAFDLFLYTSHDEGLGLPLLEIQHAGLPIFAPDKPVFREVLHTSGRFFTPGRIDEAADTVATFLCEPGWREASAVEATANLARWNKAADGDRSGVIELLLRLGAAPAGQNPYGVEA